MKILVMVAIGFALPFAAHAAKLYKWVDSNGKIHYSEIAPAPGATNVEVVPVPPAPPSSGEKGTCVSHECYAKQLERDRIEREKGYAKMHAEQERHERQVRARKVAEAAAEKRSADDEELHRLCIHGHMGFADLRDCENPKKLRAAGKRLQAKQERQAKSAK